MTSSHSQNGYSLNSLLAVINVFICLGGLMLLVIMGSNHYVNGWSVVLLWALGLQNYLMLLHEKKNMDPFIILLVIVVSAFYMGRVLTLLYNPWSMALSAGRCTVEDLNYSLIFIFFANAAIFLGLGLVAGRITSKEEDQDEDPLQYRNVIILLVLAIGVTYFIGYANSFLGRWASYISSIGFNLLMVILCSIIYLALNYKKLSRKVMVAIFVLFAVFAVFSTLSGSRAGVFVLAYLAIIAFLTVRGSIVLSNRFMMIGLFLAFIAVIFFLSASYIRGVVNPKRDPISAEELMMLKDANIFGQKNNELFERIGFLDYATVAIINSDKYREIINFPYYAQSIIDNVLTPGFTVFDVPRVAHAMSYVLRGDPLPELKDIQSAYQSDMPTAYGEYYNLFYGYPALLILFTLAYLFKRIYLAVESKDRFLFHLYRALILYVFYMWLNSFGLDWILLDIVSIVVTISLFKGFYTMKKKNGQVGMIGEAAEMPSI